MDGGARVLKLYANTINLVIIFVSDLEDQTLAIFTFIYLPKFSNFLQLRQIHSSILRSILNFQIIEVLRVVAYSTVLKITNSLLRLVFFNTFRIVISLKLYTFD
jgi:hypothetical protein